MITRYDELFCHQAEFTFDRPYTSAREWTERSWLAAYDTSGNFYLTAGFGYYPNRNVMDAFASFTIGDKTQYIVRASRELRPQIDELKVGPLSYDVLEPLKRVRFVLSDNEYGLSYDVEVHGALPIYEEAPQFQISRGRLREHITRLVQPARMSGWIKVEGETHQLTQDKWYGIRDRSWGVRMAGADFIESGTQPPEMPPGLLYTWACMQFDNWGATFHQRELWDEELSSPQIWHFSGGILEPFGSQKTAQKLTNIEHNYEMCTENPEMRKLKSGRVTLNVMDGSTKETIIHPMTINYMGTVGYGGQYKGFIHGLWMGPYWIDGHKLDLTDPEVMREVGSLLYRSYGCEFRCGNEVGYGTTDLLIIGKYPKYGYQQY